jgi:hypothetical protein
MGRAAGTHSAYSNTGARGPASAVLIPTSHTVTQYRPFSLPLTPTVIVQTATVHHPPAKFNGVFAR